VCFLYTNGASSVKQLSVALYGRSLNAAVGSLAEATFLVAGARRSAAIKRSLILTAAKSLYTSVHPVLFACVSGCACWLLRRATIHFA